MVFNGLKISILALCTYGKKLFDTNNVKKSLQFFQLFTLAIRAA